MIRQLKEDVKLLIVSVWRGNRVGGGVSVFEGQLGPRGKASYRAPFMNFLHFPYVYLEYENIVFIIPHPSPIIDSDPGNVSPSYPHSPGLEEGGGYTEVVKSIPIEVI